MCDEECSQYKDCCKDSVYYRPNEQSEPASHSCGETTAVRVFNFTKSISINKPNSFVSLVKKFILNLQYWRKKLYVRENKLGF